MQTIPTQNPPVLRIRDGRLELVVTVTIGGETVDVVTTPHNPVLFGRDVLEKLAELPVFSGSDQARPKAH